MLRLFASSLYLSVRLWLAVLASPVREGRSVGGALLVALAWPGFVVLQLLHWLGFVLDDVFFRRWRDAEVREPLFVLGPPRSGTTHLHQVLSQDPETTTFQLWECLFGVSVVGRRLALAFAQLDNKMGRPVVRLTNWLAGPINKRMADVHPLALTAPEEDFLVLLPAMQCFILVTVFPHADWLWQTARLDCLPDGDEQERLMQFYRVCVKKHVYVHGQDKRFLSKNASFSGSPQALMAAFPDARFFVCTRDPVATVPSQLSSVEPTLRLTGFDGVPVAVRERFVDLLVFYYQHLAAFKKRYPDRVVELSNADLHQGLAESVKAAYRHLDLPVGAGFESALLAADRQSRVFRSPHRYRLSDYGLSKSSIRARFASVYAISDPGPDRV